MDIEEYKKIDSLENDVAEITMTEKSVDIELFETTLSYKDLEALVEILLYAKNAGQLKYVIGLTK